LLKYSNSFSIGLPAQKAAVTKWHYCFTVCMKMIGFF